MSGTELSSASLSPERRRALYRAWHRGTREMDLLLGRFADMRLAALSQEDFAAFEALMEAQDREVFAWLTDAAPVPDNYNTGLYRSLKAFHLEGKGA